MGKKIVVGLATAFLLFAGLGSSQAEVILTDDPVFGVSSVIRDVDHGQEFLKLDFTTPYTYNEVVTECVAGGAFEGWRVASGAEMDLLGVSANIFSSSSDPDMIARTEQLRDWFGAVSISSTHEYSRGLISDFFFPVTYNGIRAQYAFSIGIAHSYDPNIISYGISGYAGLDHVVEEIFLIRNIAVPPVEEPVDPLAEEPIDGCDPLTNTGCDQVCVPTSAREKGKTCKDGVDNDCDNMIDSVDSDCGGKVDSEPDAGGNEGKGKSCSDGLDNDADGLIDCADPGCSSSRVCR